MERERKKFNVKWLVLVTAVATVVLVPQVSVKGEIVRGSLTFDDNAFADSATMITGSIDSFYGGATTVSEAITGSYFGTCFEIGEFNVGEIVEVTFADNAIFNGPGVDLAIYEAWAEDGFDVAVAWGGGSFSPYVHVEPVEEGIIDGVSVNLATVDLSTFGLSLGAVVDRIRIQEDDYDSAELVAAGAINNVPEPATMALLGLGLVGLVLKRKRGGGGPRST